MTRKQMLKEISYYIASIKSGPDEYSDYEDANEILSRLEELGMLPPPQTCKIIYDEKGPKHNEATRQWDNE